MMLSKVILLKCRSNDDRYSSARVGKLCIGIFSSLHGWLCYVSGFCLPCKVLKIVQGCVGKVMDDFICAGCSVEFCQYVFMLPQAFKLGLPPKVARGSHYPVEGFPRDRTCQQ